LRAGDEQQPDGSGNAPPPADHVHPRRAVPMAGHPGLRRWRGVIARAAWATRPLLPARNTARVSARGRRAAQVLAECVKKVRNVILMKEFGAPEAIWELEIVDFPPW